VRRALHRKQHVGVEAELEVRGDLPAEVRAGLFAQPGRYRAYVRFSNGRGTTERDGAPDLRGAAIKVVGVAGRKIIPGLEDAATQDFLMIHTPATPFIGTDEFMRFIHAAVNPALALPRLLAAFGPVKTASLLRYATGTLKPVRSLASTRFYSAVPIQWGDYAAKYSLVPHPTNGGGARKHGRDYLADDLAERLAAAPIGFDFAVQLYRDPRRTPIEDASVEWREEDAPFIEIGRLEIPKQEVAGERGQRLGAYVESLSFDPWHALEAHRPLGNIMRARNNAYRLSTAERGVAPEPDGSESFD
jgi:hypothetical protein